MILHPKRSSQLSHKCGRSRRKGRRIHRPHRGHVHIHVHRVLLRKTFGRHPRLALRQGLRALFAKVAGEIAGRCSRCILWPRRTLRRHAPHLLELQVSKVLRDHLVSAPCRCLAVRDDLLEALEAGKTAAELGRCGSVLGRLGGEAFHVPLDPFQDAVPFLGVVVDEGNGGTAVAAGATGLLDEALEAPRRGPVDDEADVGVVDPHAEGVGRYDYEERRRWSVVRWEWFCGRPHGLDAGSVCGLETRVVGHGADTLV